MGGSTHVPPTQPVFRLVLLHTEAFVWRHISTTVTLQILQLSIVFTFFAGKTISWIPNAMRAVFSFFGILITILQKPTTIRQQKAKLFFRDFTMKYD